MLQICGQDVRVGGRLLRIGRLDADGYQYADDPLAMVEALKKSRARIDLFTFTQRVTESEPKYSYPMEWDNFAVLSISTFEEWWMKQLGFKARNKAKQAEKKGVTLRQVPFNDALVQGIWEIYNECPIRQGRRFPHYGKDLNTVRKEEATYLDYSTFVGAFFEDKLIGFIKLTCDQTRTQAGLMNIVSLMSHRDKAPTNALIAQAVRVCAEQKVSHVVYSNFSYGNKQRSSLSDFKERNNFKRVDVPRYYVPLTLTGQAALRLGLHKKLLEHVPEPVLAKLRDMRTNWYNRRFHLAAEAS